ncbi:MAG TPA: helicase C-terminal domain-containing protein [Acidobacteriota bacterium]
MKASERITPKCCELLRAEIERSGGNEVCFVGALDSSGRVAGAQVVARGHQSAVVALRSQLQPGSVLLHNHPSGELVPSDADLRVAGMLGEIGVATYLIDNAVESVYPIVEVEGAGRVSELSEAEIAAAFREGGLLAQHLPQFEARAEQQQMALAAAQAFNQGSVLAVEAGTGVGKSLAYLAPALLWARRNRERVVVSTNTINLQEQLLHSDLPLLERTFGGPLRATLVKGRSHYLCRRKMEALLADQAQQLTGLEDPELAALSDWYRTTDDGSRSDLAVPVRTELWEKVQSETDTSLKKRCPHFQECFFYVARRRAAASSILIANHHLLFSDLAVKGASGAWSESSVLPPYSRIVLDEAHNLEDVATEHFGLAAGRRGLERLLGRLHRQRHGEGGLLIYLRHKLRQLHPPGAEEIAEAVDLELLPALESVRVAADRYFDQVDQIARGLAAHGDDGALQLRLTEALTEHPQWQALRQGAETDFRSALEALIADLRRFRKQLGEQLGGVEELEAERIELEAQSGRLADYAEQLIAILDGADESGPAASIRWLESRSSRAGPVLNLRLSPLQIDQAMAELVYAPHRSVILTSATLATDGNFDYLAHRLGLDRIGSRAQTLRLESPFDYARQAVLALPLDLPAPNLAGFDAACAGFIAELLKLRQGRAFVLFTSFRALRAVHRLLAAPLQACGIQALKQGDDERHRLLAAFKRGPKTALFATASFWEGVDVAGEALECVILTKLPFKVPTEPIQIARAEAIELEGGDPFRELTVPQAVIKFRQGFGRLVRSKSDRGAIVVLDRRIVEKPYGRRFLRSLPPVPLLKGSQSEVLAGLRAFFSRDPA